MTINPDELAGRLQKVLSQLRSAEHRFVRIAGGVTLLAVSKTRTSEEIRQLAALGQNAFGENYLQEAQQKMDQLQDLALEWHFIGPIQSNKTREIASRFAWVHSVDRLKVAARLSQQRPAGMGPLNICIQINIDDEATKAGCRLEALPELAAAVSALPNLCLRGLMVIPLSQTGLEAQRRPFAATQHALNDLNQQGFVLDTLSMGMSQDLDAAVAEGSTMVRVGTALFGPRVYG